MDSRVVSSGPRHQILRVESLDFDRSRIVTIVRLYGGVISTKSLFSGIPAGKAVGSHSPVLLRAVVVSKCILLVWLPPLVFRIRIFFAFISLTVEDCDFDPCKTYVDDLKTFKRSRFEKKGEKSVSLKNFLLLRNAESHRSHIAFDDHSPHSSLSEAD